MKIKHSISVAMGRVVAVAMLLVGALAVTGCGDSGKDLALERGETAAGDQHRARLANTQSDR